MAAATVLPPLKAAAPPLEPEIELRRSHLLLQLEIETALKASQSATRMLEAALEEVLKIRRGR